MQLEKTTISYSSSYQADCDNNNDKNIATRINNNANLANNKNNLKDIENHQIHFLLCKYCLWCATYLIDKGTAVSNCPICNNAKVESLPIANEEVYKLSGFTFEFGTGNMKRS